MKKSAAWFWIFVVVLYSLLLVQVRRYRDGSDWFFLVHLSRQLMAGNLSAIYQEKEYGQFYFYYGPVSLLLLVPAIWTGDLLRLSPLHQQLFHIIPFAIFDVLMALSIVGFIKEYRKLKFAEELSITTFILFMYFTLWSTLYNGRFESVALAFLFWGLRSVLRKRFLIGAVLLSLALLTKQTVLLAIIPFVAALVKDNFRNGIGVISAILFIVVVSLLPFFISGPQQFFTAMTSQVQTGISGFSIWRLIGRTPIIENTLQRFYTPLITAFMVLVGSLAWKLNLSFHDKKLVTLMVLSVLGVHLFMRTFLSYYFVFPLVFLFVWEVIWYRFPILSFIYLGVAAMIHSLGMSVETTTYTHGVLSSTIALILGLGVLVVPFRTLVKKWRNV